MTLEGLKQRIEQHRIKMKMEFEPKVQQWWIEGEQIAFIDAVIKGEIKQDVSTGPDDVQDVDGLSSI